MKKLACALAVAALVSAFPLSALSVEPGEVKADTKSVHCKNESINQTTDAPRESVIDISSGSSIAL